MDTQAMFTRPVASWGRIDIERLGGLAGYGMPGSRIRSRGNIVAKDLSLPDQAVLRELFYHPAEPAPWARDAFRYHLKRQSDCGPQVVVADEGDVPQSMRDAVHDELLPREPAPPDNNPPK